MGNEIGILVPSLYIKYVSSITKKNYFKLL